MWYHDILLQCWSEPHEFVSYFAKKLKKNQEKAITSGGLVISGTSVRDRVLGPFFMMLGQTHVNR